ncbi:cdc42 effector protein 3-like [Betta splendens]|uniref:Cdc42 effector protein 3-like n=1 Tax=Betta splendens TaxID=158456 RepID=A0A6P7LLP0_BETSP|nr:cdc42 effector protein 3-like [Betta splendens]
MPLRTSFHTKPSSGRWPRSSKRREVLSVNMISLPLADFRHITHIGNNAHRDSFGDLSFLKMGHSLLLHSSRSEQNLFMACAPPPKPPRLNVVETNGSESSDGSVEPQRSICQKRKKCTSLPLLDNEEEEEDGCQTGNNAAKQPLSLGPESVASGKNKLSTETCDKTGQKTEDDSGFSFSLDLGPSILDDVLQVMDKLHN